MQEIFFFDIPVYRNSRSNYDKETKKIITNHLNYFFSRNKYIPKEQWDERIKKETQWYYDRQYIPREFNEIIWFIKLFILWDQLRAEFYKTNQKRIRRNTKNKVIELCSLKLFETSIYHNESNKEIKLKLDEELEKLKKDNLLKNRYIDLEKYNNLANFIDRHKIIRGWK